MSLVETTPSVGGGGGGAECQSQCQSQSGSGEFAGTATCTLSKATSPTLIIENLESIITDMECPICLTMIEDTHVVPECGHRVQHN